MLMFMARDRLSDTEYCLYVHYDPLCNQIIGIQ